MSENNTREFMELTEAQRESVKQWVGTLLKWFKSCESRLQSYSTQGRTVFKLIQMMKETRMLIDETINELIEKHGLPAELKEIDEELASIMRHMVTKR